MGSCVLRGWRRATRRSQCLAGRPPMRAATDYPWSLSSPSGIGEGARLTAEAFADLGFAAGWRAVSLSLRLPGRQSRFQDSRECLPRSRRPSHYGAIDPVYRGTPIDTDASTIFFSRLVASSRHRLGGLQHPLLEADRANGTLGRMMRSLRS